MDPLLEQEAAKERAKSRAEEEEQKKADEEAMSKYLIFCLQECFFLFFSFFNVDLKSLIGSLQILVQ